MSSHYGLAKVRAGMNLNTLILRSHVPCLPKRLLQRVKRTYEARISVDVLRQLRDQIQLFENRWMHRLIGDIVRDSGKLALNCLRDTVEPC